MQNIATQPIKNLVSELMANGLKFDLSKQNSLHIRGKATKSQIETIRSHKTEIIKVLARDFSNLWKIKIDKLYEILNGFIEQGITFDVSITDFQFVDNSQILKASDKEFFKLNEAFVLCCLQQSLLMKHLFSHSPFLIDDFVFDLEERTSIKTETFNADYGLFSRAIFDVTRVWFEQLAN